jgi:hypothetical protein
MGEKQSQPFQLSFNPSLRVDSQGSRVTSDRGLLLVCELDGRLGSSLLMAKHMTDDPRDKNTQLPLPGLLRPCIYSRLAGYEDMNDAERVSQDPTFRLISSEMIWERGAALTYRLQSFETELLTQEENLAGLKAINRDLIARAESVDSPQRVVLDMDSTEISVYGQQEQSAYNGHFESTCYHPLLLFNREGDCLAAKLRPGNVHSAAGWEELLLPEIERQQTLGKEVVFRADAVFAKLEVYEVLEKWDVKYAIRIPSNDSLERDIAELLTRPVGRPSHKPVVWYRGFLYQSVSWERARRVVAKVEFHFGELFPRVGFIVTNLETNNRAVMRFYNKRRTAEQWIKEGKQAVRSHAGPARAATATHGIASWWPSQPREICLRRVGVRKGVTRVSWNPGQFPAVLVLIETVGGGPDGTRFKQRTGGTMDVHCLPFSKSKRKFRPPPAISRMAVQ